MKSKFSKVIAVLFVMVMFFSLSVNTFEVTAFAATEHVTWNPNDKNPSMTLSNNNLTAISSGLNTGVRATLGKSSGKWYWEYHIDSAGNQALGIANSSAQLNWITNTGYGSTATLYGWGGGTYPSGNNVSAQSVNSTVGVALDLDNKTVTFYLNGVVQGTPIDITAMGSKIYPYFTNDSSSNSPIITANFGATTFNYTIPVGYEPYESEQIGVPTNIITTLGDKVVNLTWDAVEGATSYSVKWGTTPGNYTNSQTVTGNTYSDITGLINGTTYYFVVTALDGTTESANSTEVSATPKSLNVTLTAEAVDKAKIGDEIIVDIVIHNANTICAEDIKIDYDTDLLEYVGTVNAEGMKVYKESDVATGLKRYITASLGKANAANGDKVLLKLVFKAKKAGEAKVDIVKGRIADNATLEVDVLDENCGEKTILIEGVKDVNRSGEFTLLDLGIDAYYYGDTATAVPTNYDADVVVDGTINDFDLTEITRLMLLNPKYLANN